MNPITIFIPGQPQAKARARSRIVTSKKTKKQFTSHYTPEHTRQYENWVARNARNVMGNLQRFDGPVMLTTKMGFEVPGSWPKWKKRMALEGRILPTSKPDADNVEKAIMDGFNQVVWLDDSQVVSGGREKYYTETPGVHAVVVALDAYPASIEREPPPEAQIDIAI